MFAEKPDAARNFTAPLGWERRRILNSAETQVSTATDAQHSRVPGALDEILSLREDQVDNGQDCPKCRR